MTHEEQIERIAAVWARWKSILGLDEWECHISYHDGEYVAHDGSPSKSAIANTHVEWEYRRTSIQWNTQRVATEDGEGLEYAVVHEAMHVLLNGQRPVCDLSDAVAREYQRLFEEHTATTLAWAFLRATKMEV